MTDWEKMQEGQIYNDFDADLFNRRVVAKKLFKEFKRTEDEEVDKRQEIMRKLFKKMGERVWMEPNFTCEFGKNIGNNYIIALFYRSSHLKYFLPLYKLCIRYNVHTHTLYNTKE